MRDPLSIYVHYPFCKSKCPYCDFNSHVRDEVNYEAFLKAYQLELDFFSNRLKDKKIKSILFGGGTPSLMPIDLVDGILKKISSIWTLDENCEISLEANPTSFESAKFRDLQATGINRISLGIQALNDQDLKFLGREHSSKEAILAIETAAKIFDNFSFDLIYARPEQSLKSWEEELVKAINFGTKHLSLYQLTIEKGTKFYSEFQRKMFSLPSEELGSEMFEATNEICDQAGLFRYEISNHAKTDYECEHNLSYWLGRDYLGIGAGAHSRCYFDGDDFRSAIMMINEPNNWLQKVLKEKNGIQNLEIISQSQLLEELILMGLRLSEGIDQSIFLRHMNRKISEIFDLKKLGFLTDEGLLSIDDSRIKISKKGFLLTNRIITKVIESIQLNFGQ